MILSTRIRSRNWSRYANVDCLGKRSLKGPLQSTMNHTARSPSCSFMNVYELSPCRMPVQYIIGEWDFRDITVKLVPPIFIPRPETEILVDLVLKRLSSSQTDSCEILDIGCGSGAISLALAHTCKMVCEMIILLSYFVLC